MKYITTHKKKEGFFIIHANRNGISYCGLVKNGIEIEYFLDYMCMNCKHCNFLLIRK